MYWENIEGWFTFQNLYKNMISSAKDNYIFVEIGTWKGKSTVFMAEQIKETKKKIKFYAIDTFVGTAGYETWDSVVNKTLYDEYLKNIEPVKDYIITIKGNSNIVHSQFENDTIDFIFIDGDHTYEGVSADLKGWYPKLKVGGVIAGHDYNEPNTGVKLAVDSFFMFKATTALEDWHSWIFKKH
jgi:predicted O-methyltransferase YrrM